MGSSMSSLSPHAPAHVPDDVVAQILLRLPAHPAELLRASLVAKRFHAIVNSRAFLCSFRSRHRERAPLLGFFHNEAGGLDVGGRFLPAAAGVCPAAFDPPADADADDWAVVDSRHGLVLLQSPGGLSFLVWDPMTRRRQEIPAPLDVNVDYECCNAAVVCPGRRDCPGGAAAGDCPFQIVFVAVEDDEVSATVSVYCSQEEDWSLAAAGEVSSLIESPPGVLVGDVLHWTLINEGILAFGMGTGAMTELAMPPEALTACEANLLVLEDGVLGLATFMKFSLHLWAHLAGDGDGEQWELRRVVELGEQLPLVPPSLVGEMPVRMLGQDEDGRVVFLRTEAGTFALELETMQFNKVIDHNMQDNIYPYRSFFLQAATVDKMEP